MKRPALGPLLWFDCSAAALAGVTMLALAGPLARLLELPTALFVCNGLVNLAYGGYSFSLARQRAPGRGWVKALVAANLTWAAVCLAIALYFGAGGNWLGAGYLLGEGIFVGALAMVEARAVRQGG